MLQKFNPWHNYTNLVLMYELQKPIQLTLGNLIIQPNDYYSNSQTFSIRMSLKHS